MTHAAHRRSLRDRFLLAAGVCLLTACSGVPLRAAIRRHIQGGRVVYTSRPERNPARVGQRVEPAGRVLPEAPPGLTKLVMASSDRHAIDPALVAAVISVESGFDAMAVSPKGARGLMQLMPSTAKEYGVSDIHDPAQNIEGGVSYLSDLRRRYHGDMRLALAAYNAGPTAVENARGVPRNGETPRYLRRIEARYGRLPRSRVESTGGRDARLHRAIRPTLDDEGRIMWTNRRPTRRRFAPGADRRRGESSRP